MIVSQNPLSADCSRIRPGEKGNAGLDAKRIQTGVWAYGNTPTSMNVPVAHAMAVQAPAEMCPEETPALITRMVIAEARLANGLPTQRGDAGLQGLVLDHLLVSDAPVA